MASMTTLLLDAARTGDLKTLNVLLADGADPNAASPIDGCSALHYAVRTEDVQCVEALIACDADVNAMDTHEATPLHFAAARASSEPIMRMLLVSSADLQITDCNGWLPIHFACIRGHDHLLSLLLESVDGSVTVCARDKNGSTPLHWSSLHGHEAAVAALLRDGNAQLLPHAIELQNARGKTAADNAREFGHSRVVELLDGWKPNAPAPLPPRMRRHSTRAPRGPQAASTDEEEVAELKSKFGIGAAALAASGIVRLRQRAAAGGAAEVTLWRRRQLERTAELPRSPLQLAAMRNIVSFDAVGSPCRVHQRTIRD